MCGIYRINSVQATYRISSVPTDCVMASYWSHSLTDGLADPPWCTANTTYKQILFKWSSNTANTKYNPLLLKLNTVYLADCVMASHSCFRSVRQSISLWVYYPVQNIQRNDRLLCGNLFSCSVHVSFFFLLFTHFFNQSLWQLCWCGKKF